MRKTLFASAFLLLLAGSASAADLACPSPVLNLDSASAPVFMAKPTPPPPPGPCTVSCYLDPTITCTSQTGSCQHPNVKGFEWITCDGVSYACPQL